MGSTHIRDMLAFLLNGNYYYDKVTRGRLQNPYFLKIVKNYADFHEIAILDVVLEEGV